MTTPQSLLKPLAMIFLLVCMATVFFQDRPMAREMRAFRRIATPVNRNLNLPKNARRTQNAQAVDPDKVKGALEKLSKAWNTSRFSDLVSDQFYDKSRLGDAMSQTGKYSTTLRIEAMESVQVLDQYVVENADGSWNRVSKVSAVARTRSEFEDASAGRVSTPGTNEIIFEITERLP